MSSSPTSSSSSEFEHPLSGLLDIVCSVEVVLGTGTISVRDCLKMQPSTVVRLNQPSGSDLAVWVQGVVAVKGEVVIVDDSTALRVTEVVPPPSAEAQQ
jgi:flagellar motor switch protein FliN/FliY